MLHSSSPSLGSNLSCTPFPYPKAMMATTGPVIWRMWDSSALCVRQSKTYHFGEAHWDARLLGLLHSFSLLEERSQWWASSKPPRGVHATGLCLSPQQPWASRPFQFLQHSVCGEEECHHSEILQKGQGDAIWMYTLCPATGKGHGHSLLNCASFQERLMWWNCSLLQCSWSPFCACLRYWKSLTGFQSSHKGILLLKSCQVCVSKRVRGLVLPMSASCCCHSLCSSLYNENVFRYCLCT